MSAKTPTTTGGRAVEQIINRSLMPKLAEECIARLSAQQPISQVTVTAASTPQGFELDIQ
ncbi:ClpB protein [Vibrio sp. JCM 19052]|nr:ClpB protein [Vibrio sp. JCM 19052]